MKLRKLLGAFALGAISLSGSAYAAGVQTAVNNYGFKLIDLAPNDGIAPSISFTSTFSQTFIDFCNCGTDQAVNFGFDFPSTVQVNGNLDGVDAGASITANNYLSRVSSGFAGTDARVSTSSDVSFTLSANTKLVFYGTLDSTQSSATGEHGWVSGSAAVGLYDAGYTKLSGFEHTFSHGLADGHTPYSEYFEIAYSNTDASEFSGNLGINSGVSMSVSAVPEPSTYAMLAAGLGLIGFLRKRRKAA
jgi:hypothetical protein